MFYIKEIHLLYDVRWSLELKLFSVYFGWLISACFFACDLLNVTTVIFVFRAGWQSETDSFLHARKYCQILVEFSSSKSFQSASYLNTKPTISNTRNGMLDKYSMEINHAEIVRLPMCVHLSVFVCPCARVCACKD